jgi:hypothetical protein
MSSFIALVSIRAVDDRLYYLLFFLVRVDIANYVAFFGCPLFEHFFILAGPEGLGIKNFKIRTQ